MDHPNIARAMDSGQLSDGRGYLVTSSTLGDNIDNKQWGSNEIQAVCDEITGYSLRNGIKGIDSVSYTHLTLPTTPYV